MPRTGRPPLPPGQKVTKREAHARYMAKLYTDPERHEAYLARKRAEKALRMQDPVKRQERNNQVRPSNAASQYRALRDPLRWPAKMLVKTRHRCKKNGIPFNLTIEDLMVPDVCPVFGTPFVFGGEHFKEDASPSIDRAKPELGYVKGNVHIISWRANHLKNNCTNGDELRKVAAYIDRLQESTNA